MPNKNLFSKEAMDKLRSPEKLDTLLEVTTPISWVTLISMVLLIISIIIWSIFGSMVTKVDGVGILLDAGGITNVTPVASGKIIDVRAYPGMHTRAGDILFVLEQPDNLIESNNAQASMYLSENEREALVRAAQYDDKRYQQEIVSYVMSEYDGIVDEVSVERGSVINAGTSICTIRRVENRSDLTGILYVPITNAKRIEPGMTIQLAPNGIDSKEDGSLLAVVRTVSQYPVSANSMMNTLGNQQLVQWVLNKADNAVMEVHFDLVKDEESESGYLWTTIIGKHKAITPGSICTGSVIVDSKPPIEKVFYKISQWLRSR